MEATEISMKGIWSCEKFPVFAIKSYKIDAFIMGYPLYKTPGTLSIAEELLDVTESTNLRDKCGVAVQINDRKVVGLLLL